MKLYSTATYAVALSSIVSTAFAQTLVVGPNVNINRQTAYQGEEAIAIDPSNPNRLFAWANDLDSSARNSAAFSTNGGATWTARFTGSDGWPTLGGDPTCSFDKFGNLFASSFNGNFSSLLIRASSNGGQTFPISVGTISSPNLDQPTVKAGPGTSPGQQALWIFYLDSPMIARGVVVTGLGAIGALGPALAVPGSDFGNFGDITIGPNGQVAVAYQTPADGTEPCAIKFALNSSGSTSGSFVASPASISINVGGFRSIPAQPSRTVDAEVGLAYDISNGPHRGRLYLIYTDAPSTTSNDLNIFLRHSDNDGTTWSAPLRVNDDTGTKSQFFSKIALDPVTGNVGLAWYDCRNSSANNRVELWATVSVDGGVSVLPNVKVSAGSTTGVGLGSGNELGDYIGLDFYNNAMYPCWADDSNSTGDNPNGTGNLDYYTARVNVVYPPVPSLAITSAQFNGSAEVLTLSWTNNGANVGLQGTGTLPGTWSTVNTPRTTNNNFVLTTVTNSASAQFYRLSR
jgi:hypothetical protein